MFHKFIVCLAVITLTFCDKINISENESIFTNKIVDNFTSTHIEMMNSYPKLNNYRKFTYVKAPDLIKNNGYELEVHHVKTKDGYILEMHRMWNSSAEMVNSTRRPVLLMHGLLDSSTGWLINGKQNSLGFILADSGYDVWLGNARGNYFSRRHSTLNPDGNLNERMKYWTFSWHEIGIYDLPAMIDYILQKNINFDKIHYIGDSQGTTAFFVMASELPEYNDKILTMNALAPVAFAANAKGLGKTFALIIEEFEPVLKSLGIFDVLPGNSFITSSLQEFCSDVNTAKVICLNFIFLVAGRNPKSIKPEMASHFLSHLPSGASIYQIIHYVQLTRSNSFQKYDFGKHLNQKIYGSNYPPKYNLYKISAPVALHYGSNDYLADTIDVYKLARELPNIINLHNIQDPDFNHADFLVAWSAGTLVYNEVLRIMKKWEQ